MAQLKLVTPPFHAFPYRKWNPVARMLHDEYRANSPLPHVYLADFLEDDVALAVAREFPGPASPAWTYYKHQTEGKQNIDPSGLFPGTLSKVVDEFNSEEFAQWLSGVTGISRLVPDPCLNGAGLHRMYRGDWLDIHTELPCRHPHRNWLRRVTLIIYLTPGWREEWGGTLEFWNTSKRCVSKYPALFNHAVISNTDDRVLQGFGNPLECPDKVTRNSLQLYYYAVEDRPRSTARSGAHRAWSGNIPGNVRNWSRKWTTMYSYIQRIFGLLGEI